MIDVTKKVIHWEANHPRVYVSVFSRKSLTSIVPIKHLSFPLVSYHFQSNHHGNQRLFAASCIPYNCWILHQLGQLWARHDLSALASLLPCLSPFWIQIVWSRLGYVSFSKSTSMYLLKICFRLDGILANLERNRQKTGHSGHLCFAGRKLMFPVPSDEEGAKAFKKALDTFSMVIQHRNQE